MTSKKIKQIEEQIKYMSQWIDEHDMPLGNSNLLENMNFLVDNVRHYRRYIEEIREENERHRNTLGLTGRFLEENDLMSKWDDFFKNETEQEEHDPNAAEREKLEAMATEEGSI